MWAADLGQLDKDLAWLLHIVGALWAGLLNGVELNVQGQVAASSGHVFRVCPLVDLYLMGKSLAH